jgi:hypothetical protein
MTLRYSSLAGIGGLVVESDAHQSTFPEGGLLAQTSLQIVSVTLTGQAATASGGTSIAQINVLPVGIAASFAQGSILAGPNELLSGASISTAGGTLVPTVANSGTGHISSTGDIFAEFLDGASFGPPVSIDLQLTGAVIASGRGTVVGQLGGVVFLSGTNALPTMAGAQGVFVVSNAIPVVGQLTAAAYTSPIVLRDVQVSWAQIQMPISSGAAVRLTGTVLNVGGGALLPDSVFTIPGDAFTAFQFGGSLHTGSNASVTVSWAQLVIPQSNNKIINLTGKSIVTGQGVVQAVSGTFIQLNGVASTFTQGAVVSAVGPTLSGQVALNFAGVVQGSTENFILQGDSTILIDVLVLGTPVAVARGNISTLVNGAVNVNLDGLVLTSAEGTDIVTEVIALSSGIPMQQDSGVVQGIGDITIVLSGADLTLTRGDPHTALAVATFFFSGFDVFTAVASLIPELPQSLGQLTTMSSNAGIVIGQSLSGTVIPLTGIDAFSNEGTIVFLDHFASLSGLQGVLLPGIAFGSGPITAQVIPFNTLVVEREDRIFLVEAA